MSNFEKSVFVNCPFDGEYRDLLYPMLFTIKYLGFVPRLSSEKMNSGDIRLSKILGLIKSCKYGIHDLSRIAAENAGDLARMNMPFELGIDYGCKTYDKECSEKEKYRYQQAISDFSGADIQSHGGDPVQLIQIVRDSLIKIGASPRKIWYSYNLFLGEYQDSLINEGYQEDDFDKIPVHIVMAYMDLWLRVNNPISVN